MRARLRPKEPPCRPGRARSPCAQRPVAPRGRGGMRAFSTGRGRFGLFPSRASRPAFGARNTGGGEGCHSPCPARHTTRGCHSSAVMPTSVAGCARFMRRETARLCADCGSGMCQVRQPAAVDLNAIPERPPVCRGRGCYIIAGRPRLLRHYWQVPSLLRLLMLRIRELRRTTS